MHDLILVRPCLTNSFLSLLNSKTRPTPCARLPPFTPLSTFYPCRIEGYLDISSYFFQFLPISHCSALLLSIHFYAKANLFTFPNSNYTRPLPPSFLSFPSAITTHIRSSIERSKSPLWYIYVASDPFIKIVPIIYTFLLGSLPRQICTVILRAPNQNVPLPCWTSVNASTTFLAWRVSQ